jgi:hypothetical protein
MTAGGYVYHEESNGVRYEGHVEATGKCLEGVAAVHQESRVNRRTFLKAVPACALWPALAGGKGKDETGRYRAMVASHLRRILESGTDDGGPVRTGMWLASLDTRTGAPVKDNTPRRVYRLIGAPNGSTLYWDQPLVVTAFELSRLSDDPRYARAAAAYIQAFLEHCVADDGMFQWGNHQYYDIVEDRVVRFSGGYHELRPITPAWELFWRTAPGVCERYIRTMADRHLFDRETGGFNRHDNRTREHAFLESGGILAESLAWLYAKTRDPDLLGTALRIARYSYRHRGAETGLVVNEPDKGRWDAKVSTTEVGVWAQSLLRAAEYTSCREFVEMAAGAIGAYLKYGYDAKAQRYYGQLEVATGRPVVPAAKGYWPGRYSDIFNSDQWPTHDYPMAFADACLTLHELTGIGAFEVGAKHWAHIVENGIPAPRDRVVYAEQYGRCIRFLVRASRRLQEPALLGTASRLAGEATERLYENGMFQGYPGGHLYESVDGVGFLCLALLALEESAELRSYGLNA